MRVDIISQLFCNYRAFDRYLQIQPAVVLNNHVAQLKRFANVPFLSVPEIAGPYFATRVPAASSGKSPDIVAYIGRKPNKVLEACARLSGGHPRCATTVLAPELDPDSTQYKWAALLRGCSLHRTFSVSTRPPTLLRWDARKWMIGSEIESSLLKAPIGMSCR
jgi:hypothetical protein